MKKIITEIINSDLETPISIYLKLAKYHKNSFLLESVANPNSKGRYSVIGLLPDIIWQLDKNDISTIFYNKEQQRYQEILKNQNFEKIKNSLEELIKESKLPNNDVLPPMASGLFGYMSYDMVQLFENIPAHKKNSINIPRAKYIRPTILVIFDNVVGNIILSCPIFRKEDVFARKNLMLEIKKLIKTNLVRQENNSVIQKINFVAETSREQYCKMIEKSKEYIRAGDVFQIVPSRRFSVKNYPYSGFSFFRALRNVSPSPYLFYLNFVDFEIIGASPEILVRSTKDTITIKPLAGTRKRGKNSEEDKKLATELLADEKEIAEHLMLIDLARNDIARVAKNNSVKVTKKMVVEYYYYVMHISSTVSGVRDENKTNLENLIAGFPAGTLSGAPKIKAMEIIAELEEEERNFYAGVVGYFSSHQNYMDTAIMLRTALLKDKTLYAQAGAGIVYDSKEEEEANETEHKAQAIFKASQIAYEYE